MTSPNFILLYVEDALASADFYSKILNLEPADAQPGFAMFRFGSGLTLGLWSKSTVEPKATPAGGSEIGFPVGGAAAVDRTCEAWKKTGLPIVQQPTDMNFGRTFVALDPDGHRLRVFAPAA